MKIINSGNRKITGVAEKPKKKRMKITILISLLLTLLPSVLTFLKIENGKFVYNNQTIFLSGVNAPWVNYGQDFGKWFSIYKKKNQ